MKYLKIKAKTYQEAKEKLKSQYGDDAIPISHKFVKEGGVLNSKFFAKKIVELTAAVQEKPLGKRASKSNFNYTVSDDSNLDEEFAGSENRSSIKRKGTLIDSLNSESDVKNFLKSANQLKSKSKKSPLDSINKNIDDINNNLGKFASDGKMEIAKTIIDKKNSSASLHKRSSSEKIVNTDDNNFIENSIIQKELEDLKDLKKSIQRLLADKEVSSISEQSIFNDSEEEFALNPFFETLKNNDFSNEECKRMILNVKKSIAKEDLKDNVKIEKSLKELLKSKIVTSGAIQKSSKKKIYMFVGPTGVGKTTTMAKLGALHSLKEQQRVVFITIDNYRIAATEQLKKYAEIMQIPIYSVNDQKEFKKIIDNEKADIIMIDTSGRSHNNKMKIAEIKSFADIIDYDLKKILCVSANTKKNDLDRVFRSFDVMDFDSLIITKVDETSFVGNVVDIADKYNKPISYFTNGQEVPNDIVVADQENIVDLIVRNPN